MPSNLYRETPDQLKMLLQQRQFLDRRRLEEAFLLYASLEIIQRHNLWKELATLPCERNEMIENVTKQYSHAFSKKWEGNVI